MNEEAMAHVGPQCYRKYIYIYICIYIYNTHNILVVFYTCTPIYCYNYYNNFDIVTIMYNIYVILSIDNAITACIHYKELYDCKRDPMTLTNNTF